MLEIASTQGLLDHDTSRAVLVIWTAPSAPLIFYPQQFIWSSVCTHTVHFRKKLSPQSQWGEVLLHGLQWWFRDRVKDKGKAAPLQQEGSPGKGCESMSVGVGTCAMLLGYFKVLCPSPLSHWIHVTTPCVKGFFKSPRPPFPPSPPLSDSYRRLAEIMADSCETKHSFNAVYDIKVGLRFFSLPLSISFFFSCSSSFLREPDLLCAAPWVDCMWRGWCIDHRQSFDSCVHPNTEKFMLKGEWLWSESSSQRSLVLAIRLHFSFWHSKNNAEAL